jgi:outer membrane protein TolC
VALPGLRRTLRAREVAAGESRAAGIVLAAAEGMTALAATLALLLAAAPEAPPLLKGMPKVTSMSLPEALAELDRQNPSLEEARSRAAAALGVVKQVTAPLLPNLSAGGGYFHNNASVIITAPQGGALERIYIQPLDAWYGSAALRVPLIVPEAWFSVAAARDSALAAAEASNATRLTVRTALVQSAWTAWAGDEVVAASERAVASARSQADAAHRMLQAGTGTPLAQLQAETSAIRRESDLVAARSERSRARIAVGVLLGRPDPVAITLPPMPTATEYDVESLFREALDARPELRASAAVVSAYEKQQSAALWRLAPTISASGAAQGQTVPFPTGDKGGWRVSVDLTWTLYDGGFRYGKADQAAAQAAEARAAETGTRLQILQEVQNAARDVEVARQRLLLARQERETASSAAASARRGFGEGITSSLDVLSANDALYGSEIQVANASARLGGSLAALDRAVGRVP